MGPFLRYGEGEALPGVAKTRVLRLERGLNHSGQQIIAVTFAAPYDPLGGYWVGWGGVGPIAASGTARANGQGAQPDPLNRTHRQPADEDERDHLR